MPKKILPLPSRDALIGLLEYFPEIGIVKFRNGGPGICRCGKYMHIIIEGKHYLAHRIIWKMMTGSDPSALVDHVDTNGLNNRWKNLRIATDAENIMNSKLSRANTSGIKGVSFDRQNSKWRAHIMVGRKCFNLGRYKSFDDAVAARMRSAELMHGEFARH
jgi:hypothetical protein